MKVSKKNKSPCFECNTFSPGNVLKCKFCKRISHESCATKYISADRLLTKIKNPETFQCKDCMIKVTHNDYAEDDTGSANEETEMIAAATLKVAEYTSVVEKNQRVTTDVNIVKYKCDQCVFECEETEFLDKNNQEQIDIACDLCVLMTTTISEMESHVVDNHKEMTGSNDHITLLEEEDTTY